MGKLSLRRLACVRCQRIWHVHVATAINAQRTPAAYAAILAGTLHHFRCDGCGHDHIVESNLSYFDSERRLYVVVDPFPDAELRRQRYRDDFRLAMTNAPEVIRATAASYLCAMVASLTELRTCLTIWAAPRSSFSPAQLAQWTWVAAA